MTNNKTICKNCGLKLEGNYCISCGQSADVKQFSLHNFLHEFIHGFFHIHGGLLFTIKELFLHPGIMLRGYLEGKRIYHFNPFTYLVLISVIMKFLIPKTGLMVHSEHIEIITPETVNFLSNHFNVRLLLTIPIYSFLGILFFRTYKYNFLEYLIVFTYILSQSSLILALCFIFLSVFTFTNTMYEYIYLLSLFAVLVYQIAASYLFFKKGNKLYQLAGSIIIVGIGYAISYFTINYIIVNY